MSDTARLLLTAALLTGTSFGFYAWRLSRVDSSTPERLIGELRLSQIAAILLATMGAIPAGLALAAGSTEGANFDAAIGIAFIVLAGFLLFRHPREALLIAFGGFLTHAFVDLAHRPGLLPPEVVPRWYAVTCATYGLYLAAVCYWARRH